MNTVEVKCPGCGAEYSLGKEYWDKNAVCPECETTFYVAPPASVAGDEALGDWKVGDVVLDDYEVKGIHDGGGMGNVFLVQSRSTNMRFAAKRSKKLGEAARQDFLRELQTWIDLPEHPNIVPCRFFRTVNDEVVIFAEYVEGGSLREWIDTKKLYEGGPKEALKRILDIAIQMAWGLHQAHEQGVVHQDVKPANVMMTPDGTAKVGDFGLAKARTRTGEMPSADPKRSVLVSSGWMTPQYCSPEQAMGQALSRRTDIWSWGVSVLEMFIGEATWQSGHLAAAVLEQYLADGMKEGLIPEMPPEVVEVLRRCFLHDASQRWQNLAEVVESLKTVFWRTIGVEYTRALDVVERPAALPAGIKERLTREGAPWADPQEWLARACRAEGRTPVESRATNSKRQGSRRGDLVADLRVYDEARRIYERLMKGRQEEIEADLAALCLEKALVHSTAGDIPGCLAEYDRAIEICDRLVREKGRWDLAGQLSEGYLNKAATLNALGDNRAAVGLYDKAIEAWDRLEERWPYKLARAVLVQGRATAYMNKGNAVLALGEKETALKLYDQARQAWEQLVYGEGHRELMNGLALTYLNKGNALSALGDYEGSVRLYDQAIDVLRNLVEKGGRRELASELARATYNKGISYCRLEEYDMAVEVLDRSIVIWERLVQQERRQELANDLAKAYMVKGGVMIELGDPSAAAELYDRAVKVRERLVNQEGHRELAKDLELAYKMKADALKAVDDSGREYSSSYCHVCGGLIEATDDFDEWLDCPHCREKLERLSNDHAARVVLEREAAGRGEQTTLFCTKWLMTMSEVRRAVPHVQAHPDYRNCLWHAGELCARPVGFTYHFENDALTKILINFQGLEGSVKDFERTQAQLSRDFCSMSAPCATDEWTLFSRGEANGFIAEHAARNWVTDGMIEKIMFYPPAFGSGVKNNP